MTSGDASFVQAQTTPVNEIHFRRARSADPQANIEIVGSDGTVRGGFSCSVKAWELLQCALEEWGFRTEEG